MGTSTEDMIPHTAKSGQKSPPESRPNRIMKRGKDKKPIKVLDPDAVFDAIHDNLSDTEGGLNNKDKKSQGIVIDGKTYTCTACKTGHRVGVCKHARERPMTATHPPGRPPAGAPKKVVCDCPKQCNCKKRDCKCARNCSCTQRMYMLVFIPAPGTEQDADDEEGTWTLGQQVTTDLKGNVLTLDQVKQRQEQKEAQKTQSVKGAGGIRSMPSVDEVRSDRPLEQEPMLEGSADCCSHKENVALRNATSVTAPRPSDNSKTAAHGCNCGQTCSCTFCPEHPNNPASVNMARQQAMHFTNQYRDMNEQPIMPFIPAMQQQASCMGYAPQYAVSKTPGMPSGADMQRMFPNPGFVIQYPFWSLRTNAAGYPVVPFPMQHAFPPNTGMINDGGFSDLQTPMTTPPVDLPQLDFSQDEFGIGSAYVASAGSEGLEPFAWDPNGWSTGNAVISPTGDGYLEIPNFAAHGPENPLMAATATTNSGFGFANDMRVPTDDGFLNLTAVARRMPMADTNPQVQPSGSCCATTQDQDGLDEDFGNSENRVSLGKRYITPSVMKPHG